MSQRLDPGPGQESVWDYPRPPKIEPAPRRIQVEFAGTVVADTTRSVRLLETGVAPVYYIPSEDVSAEYLHANGERTACEFKGVADWFDLVVGGRRSEMAAWTYAEPVPEYQLIRGYLAFYAGKVDAALVDGEHAVPQPGEFLGGWITKDIVGPFAGEPGVAP